MSDKRFTTYYENEAVFEDNGKMITNKEVVDLLNEQQDTIEQLKKELEELENNYKDLLYDGGFDE